jgi:hypothetical protein
MIKNKNIDSLEALIKSGAGQRRGAYRLRHEHGRYGH